MKTLSLFADSFVVKACEKVEEELRSIYYKYSNPESVGEERDFTFIGEIWYLVETIRSLVNDRPENICYQDLFTFFIQHCQESIEAHQDKWTPSAIEALDDLCMDLGLDADENPEEQP